MERAKRLENAYHDGQHGRLSLSESIAELELERWDERSPSLASYWKISKDHSYFLPTRGINEVLHGIGDAYSKSRMKRQHELRRMTSNRTGRRISESGWNVGVYFSWKSIISLSERKLIGTELHALAVVSRSAIQIRLGRVTKI